MHHLALFQLSSIRLKVQNMQKYDNFNLLALRDHLRKLKNRLESCRHYDKTQLDQCSNVFLSNISSPVVTQLNPYGTTYPFGAWGKESRHGSPELYWVQSLQSGNTYGITLRTYSSFEDFVMSRNHKDIPVTPSYTTTYSIQGPGTVLYNESLYYNCYKSPNVCKYDLKTNTIQHIALPDAGHDNKFPYCYYSCYGTTDIDLSVDETGLWDIYATEENYGNIVISKQNSSTLAMVQTWKLFKKSVTNVFMVCGVLYATRYLSPKLEGVFYVFDTVTGHDTNNLSVPFEKISTDIQNLHYNPTDHRLYLLNYANAYELTF
ncbi:olfactomedin-4-like [Polyodon spathula]|uniref:olfactomedin-4-like n=1 Tax=Polyodon spathula TaxID=7913 RepID=UPI001B7DAE89|nr:olfactomedin-4-like [Polyodon spathula]